MDTFTHYRQGNYPETINSGKRYVSLYPTNPDAAYAQYIVGLSYYRQIRDVTQDQKEARKTIEAMDEVVQRWPDSEYVEDAKAKIRFARDQLAGKEMQIGRYYLERREYIAAIKRFRNVVETYSNTRQVEEALSRLTEAYYAMGLADEAQTAAAVLGNNYPDSQWYKDSYALAAKRRPGAARESGSWLSKAGKVLGRTRKGRSPEKPGNRFSRSDARTQRGFRYRRTPRAPVDWPNACYRICRSAISS